MNMSPGLCWRESCLLPVRRARQVRALVQWACLGQMLGFLLKLLFIQFVFMNKTEIPFVWHSKYKYKKNVPLHTHTQQGGEKCVSLMTMASKTVHSAKEK